MGERVPLTSPYDRQIDAAVRPYRDTLREIRRVAAMADEGLYEPGPALRLAANAAIRQLGEVPK